MVVKNWLFKAVPSVSLIAVLSACGGGSSGSDDDRLSCTAPQVLNSAGTACITPAEDNNAPEITSAGSFSVAEGADIGTVVYSATGTDADGDNISWSLTDGQSIFAIDASSGEISVADNSNLIAANLSDYSITLTATDDATDSESASLTLEVTVEASNSAPMITSADNFAVDEGEANGTVVYSATASDAEGDTIVWSLTDAQSIFAIDSSTGEVSIADNSNLVAADLTNYTLTLTATEDSSDALDDSQTITVTVNEVSGNGATPSVTPAAGEAIIYYYRADGDYTDWIIHAWNNDTCNGYADLADGEGTDWATGLAPTGTDSNFGVYWLFDVKDGATCANYIIHKGDTKDPNDSDQVLDMSGDRWAFAVSGVGIFNDPDDVSTEAPFSITDASAHWIDANTVLYNGSATDLRLVSSSTGMLDETFDIAESLSLTATTLTTEQQERVPHLGDWTAYTFDATVAEQKDWLTRQLVVAELDGDEAPVAATYVQTAKALDAFYTFGDADADEVTDLGISYAGDTITAKVWAPTAQDLNLKVYSGDSVNSKTLVATHDMTLDTTTGIWSFTTDDSMDYDRLFFRYEVTVYHPVTRRVETTEATDPYSVNTSTNGRYSQFVNMSDDDLKPAGWDGHVVPTVENPEDAVLLEGHIRDFSIFDNTTSVANRGKYMAFTEAGTDANAYLQELAESGVTHFHMLPANDIATINEDPTETVNLTDTVADLCAANSSASVCGELDNSMTLLEAFESFDVASNDARDLANDMRGLDSFNWGYDPHHFNVVEGSYASDPEGVTRIKEFREMVQALHNNGLRVVLDVVYNHTSSSGLFDNSVFDKLVPGYYHRYSEVSGDIERSTCCENTATEHRMMGKFVIDSLAFWVEQYGLDGIRFDVMGHMPADVILDGRDAVWEIDPDNYFYGEGWDWGEVANNRLFYQATQYNLADSEVGTFNDRPRDTIRSNALGRSTSSLSDADHIRLGMAGTLQNYELVDANGDIRLGRNFGQSSYALDPADIINYISKHDNETLWDILQDTANVSSDTDADTRVRIHSLSAAIPLMSQGIPFFQLAVDKLRSKSLDRNTYDSGDWFNRIDYTEMSNNWNVGYPVEVSSVWSAETAANTNMEVTPTLISRSSDVFNEFLQIRSSSELFRLTTEQQVINRVGFHNTGASQTRGLIVMSIDDGIGQTDLDANHDAIVVVVNGSDAQQSHEVKTASGFTLHSVQMSSVDSVVQGASFAEEVRDGDTYGTFTVPAYTVAVFVKEQGSEQGEGLNPDPDFVASQYNDAELVVSGFGSDATMSYDDRGNYTVSVTVDSGATEFDIADSEGSVVDLAFADVTVSDDSIALSAGSSDNFAITFDDAGSYLISLNVEAATPVLEVTLLNALVSCPAPVSAGAAPFAISGGGNLYVRGDHSGWNAEEAYKMTYIGENQYKAVAEFPDSFQFKLASDDGSWTTQLWVQDNSGTIETSNLDVGITYDVAYDNAGTGNNSMSVTAGTYSFLLTLNEDNPAVGTNVGTLIIEQCD